MTDLCYQSGSWYLTTIRPVVFSSRRRNNPRQGRLASTRDFGKAGFESKRVETNTNATERGWLGM